MKVNLAAIQEDIRRIAIALFLAVVVNTLIGNGSIVEQTWTILFTIITWLFGIIERVKESGGGQ